MSKRPYAYVQILLPDIRKTIAAEKTQREIAEHFGFPGKAVVQQLLIRERRKFQKKA